MRVRGTRPAAAAVAAVLAAFLLASCVTDEGSSPVPDDAPIVVTFEVGDETFRALLTDPADIAVAHRLLAGEDAPSIPNGLVMRDTGVNDGWTWSLDPDDLEFADVTMEVCDGTPSDVEAGIVTSERYCPWSAVVVGIEPAP